MTKKPEKKPAEAGKVTKLPASQVAPKTAKAKVATVYAGPNVPGGVLSQFTVFREGVLAPHVKQIVERYPAIKRLIVPVSRLRSEEHTSEPVTFRYRMPSSACKTKWHPLRCPDRRQR